MTRSDPHASEARDGWRRRSSRAVALLVLCCLLTTGVDVAAAHVGHDGSTPSEPLEPAESPPWTATGLAGGVGVLVVVAASKAARDGRVSGRLGGAVAAVGVLLLLGAIAAFAWLRSGQL